MGRARSLPGNAHMPATPATDREPSPCPPCRGYFFCLGRVCVSRPVEGLDSSGAVRTLRMRRTRASSAAASRPQNSSNAGVAMCMWSGHAFCFGHAGLRCGRCEAMGETCPVHARPDPSNATKLANAKRTRSRANTKSAAFGRRAGCQGPRWAETRSLFPNNKSSRGRVGRGLSRGHMPG